MGMLRIFSIAMILLCASNTPSLALDDGSGATALDAKSAGPLSTDFNPAPDSGFTVPKPDPRYGNNPALNNLVAPPEKVAPELKQQDDAEMEADFEKTDDEKKAGEGTKKHKRHPMAAAKGKKINANATLAPKRKKRDLPPDASPADAANNPASRAQAAASAKENGGIALPPPLEEPKPHRGPAYAEAKEKQAHAAQNDDNNDSSEDLVALPPKTTNEVAKTTDNTDALEGTEPAALQPVTKETKSKNNKLKKNKLGIAGGPNGKNSSTDDDDGQPKIETIKPEERNVEDLFDEMNQ